MNVLCGIELPVRWPSAWRGCELSEPSPKGLGWMNCWTFGPEVGKTRRILSVIAGK